MAPVYFTQPKTLLFFIFMCLQQTTTTSINVVVDMNVDYGVCVFWGRITTTTKKMKNNNKFTVTMPKLKAKNFNKKATTKTIKWNKLRLIQALQIKLFEVYVCCMIWTLEKNNRKMKTKTKKINKIFKYHKTPTKNWKSTKNNKTNKNKDFKWPVIVSAIQHWRTNVLKKQQPWNRWLFVTFSIQAHQKKLKKEET